MLNTQHSIRKAQLHMIIYPKHSMYAIYAYIGVVSVVNVGIYGMHGSVWVLIAGGRKMESQQHWVLCFDAESRGSGPGRRVSL